MRDRWVAAATTWILGPSSVTGERGTLFAPIGFDDRGSESSLPDFRVMSAIDQDFLRDLAERARSRGDFGAIETKGNRLQCAAKDAAADAWYCVEQRDGAWHLVLMTPDRWLSESIESDLMHTGDSLEELLEEELVELGVEASPPPIKHYRSDDRLYTFDLRLPDGHNPELVSKYLFAFEAAFRNLGDMSSPDEGG